KEGKVWLGALLLVIGLFWGGSHVVSGMPFYYPDIQIRQLLVTLVVVSIGLYVYQRSREQWEARALKSQRELKAYLKQMTELHARVDHTKNEFVTLTSHQLRT